MFSTVPGDPVYPHAGRNRGVDFGSAFVAAIARLCRCRVRISARRFRSRVNSASAASTAARDRAFAVALARTSFSHRSAVSARFSSAIRSRSCHGFFPPSANPGSIIAAKSQSTKSTSSSNRVTGTFVGRALRVVPYKATSGWRSKASVGFERHRWRGLKAGDGRRETRDKVLKDRRSPRRRGRMGTSV